MYNFPLVGQMADRIVAGFPFKHSSRYTDSEPIPTGLVFSESAALPIPLGGSQVGSFFQKTDRKPIRLISFQAAKEGDTKPDSTRTGGFADVLGMAEQQPQRPAVLW